MKDEKDTDLKINPFEPEPKEEDDLQDRFNNIWNSLGDSQRESYEARLRSIIKAELTNLVFDMKCDDYRSTMKGHTSPVSDDTTIVDERAETITQASARRAKERKKKREKIAREIEKKKNHRAKCRQKQLTEELQRWKVLADI